MRAGRTVALAALPGVAAVAFWNGYRHAVHEFSAHRTAPPRLPGRVRSIPTDWGRLTYRLVRGTDPGPPLVLVHGWGRSADSVWWQLMARTERTLVAVDLPGHGRSILERPFTFNLAAQVVIAAITDAGLIRPVIVAHSMGGPIALTVLRRSRRHEFTGFVAIATSAYWIRPRQQLIVAAAPYLLAPSSPILIGRQRAEVRREPDQAARIAWEYAMRPPRRVLEESAAALRRFDSRRWGQLSLPPTVWIVTLDDGVMAPYDQRASAIHFGASVVDVASDHPVIMRASGEVAGIIEDSIHTWTRQPPIGIRRRAGRPSPRFDPSFSASADLSQETPK